MQLNEVKQKVAELHDNTTMLAMRYGGVNKEGVASSSGGGCFYGISGYINNGGYPYVFAAFHGDGAAMPFEALRNNSVYNATMLAHQVPWNKFTGTPRSRRWVEYLLSEKSPWAALHPFIAEKDPDYINSAGFIFGDGKSANMPRKLAYNFIMAIRYPWEMSRNYELMLRLMDDEGLDPNVACFISMNYTLSPKATDLNGPYDIIYPWSFLEETNLEAAGRFILGKPGTLTTDGNCTPGTVSELWKCQTKGEVFDHSQKIYQSFCDDDNLTLAKIISGINACLDKQKAII